MTLILRNITTRRTQCLLSNIKELFCTILQCILVKELFREHKKVSKEEMQMINKYINDIKSTNLYSVQDYHNLFDLIKRQKEGIEIFRKRTTVSYSCEEVLKNHGGCKAIRSLRNIDQDEVSYLQCEPESLYLFEEDAEAKSVSNHPTPPPPPSSNNIPETQGSDESHDDDDDDDDDDSNYENEGSDGNDDDDNEGGKNISKKTMLSWFHEYQKNNGQFNENLRGLSTRRNF